MPEDLDKFSKLVKLCGLNEEEKSGDRSKLGGHVILLHEVISKGLKAIADESS